jgi:hypothetical protein
VFPYGADRRIDTQVAEGCLAHWQTFVDLLSELGYPAEVQYRNGANYLRVLGRDSESEELIRAMVDFAGDTRPLVRGHALEMLADRHLRRGELEVGLDMCRESARLLVDGGDLDFAAEAERRRANAHTLLEQYDEAGEALRRHDEYRALIGLPPITVEEPLLAAASSAGSQVWDEFVTVMRDFVSSAPDPDDPDYEQFLVGDPDRLEHYVHMIEPLARWLMSLGRDDAAATLVRAAPMAFEETAFDLWTEVGDIARVDRLDEELSDVEVSKVPKTLEELWCSMVEYLTEG